VSHMKEQWDKLADLPAPEATRKVFTDKKRQCMSCEAEEMHRAQELAQDAFGLDTFIDYCSRCALCMLDDFKALYEVQAPPGTIFMYFDFIRECIPCMMRQIKNAIKVKSGAGSGEKTGGQAAG